MKKNKNKYFLIVAAIFVLICFLEGIVYYHSTTENTFMALMLNLQNILKAFLLSSNIEIKDTAFLLDSGSQLVRILQYLYSFVLLAAPVFTTVTIVTLSKHLYLHLLLHFRWRNKKQISVLGDTAYAHKLASHLTEEYHTLLYLHEEVNREANVRYLEESMDTFSLDPENAAALFESNHLESSEAILIMEEDAIQNLVTFEKVLSYLKQSTPTHYCTCIVLCEDDAVRDMMEESYQRCIAENALLKATTELLLLPLTQLEAMEMLNTTPLYQYHLRTYEEHRSEPDFWDQHIAVAGFGLLGQQLVLQALESGVLSSESRMIFDVFDPQMEHQKGVFLRNFSIHLTSDVTDTFVLPKESSMDGTVIIRFHSVDFSTYSFEKQFHKLHGETSFTYAAICTEDPRDGYHAMLSMEKIWTAEEKARIPLAFYLPEGETVRQYLNTNQERYRNVTVSMSLTELLDSHTIRSYVNDAYAMSFNLCYNRIDMRDSSTWFGSKSDSPKELLDAWQKMSLVKRHSSRSLSLHQTSKLLRMAAYCFERKEISESFEEYFQSLLLMQEQNPAALAKEFHEIYEQFYALSQHSDTTAFLQALNQNAFLRECGALEHRRWCHFTYTAGYHYRDAKKDDVSRTNPCLLSWDDLCTKLPEYCQYDLVAYLLLLGDVASME